MLDVQAKPGLDADAVRREARALAEIGRFRDAVATGHAAAGEGADPAFEVEMVAWRHRAHYAEQKRPAPRADWPPRLADPRPERPDEIPEISPAELNADLLGGALLHHGSLIIRGLLSNQEAKRWTDNIDQAYAARDQLPGADANLLSPLDAINLRALEDARLFNDGTSMLSVDAPRLLNQWIKVVERCGVLAAVSGYLGERPVLSGSKARLYRVPHNAGSQWHQDGAFLGGKEVRTVNLWVALTDCGEDAPGLEIVPWRVDDVLPTGTHGSFFNWSVGEQMIPELAHGRSTANPTFKAGDAMLFDHLCLHRTGSRPEMTRGRYAIETWMFSPSAYADIQAIVL